MHRFPPRIGSPRSRAGGREQDGDEPRGSALPGSSPQEGANGTPGYYVEGLITFKNRGKEGDSWMVSVTLHSREVARCGQQEGDEKEVLALTTALTQGGDQKVTGESGEAQGLPWQLTT